MKPRQLFIHIGYHKTGTSALQAFLWENRMRLASVGVHYPEVALSGSTHAKLANVLKGADFERAVALMRRHPAVDDEPDPYALRPDEDEHRLYDELHSAVLRPELPVTVISSECFLEWIDPKRVAAHVLQWGVPVKIVVYLRRQDRWIESVYNQIVKDQYLRYSGDFASMPQHEQLDYYATLEKWRSAFGDNSLIVRVYEPEQLKGGDVISDFLSLLDITDLYDFEEMGRRENPSLHREVVWLLRKTNQLMVSLQQHRLIREALYPLSEQLLQKDGRNGLSLLGKALRTRILARYRERNAAVARRFLGRENGVLFNDRD